MLIQTNFIDRDLRVRMISYPTIATSASSSSTIICFHSKGLRAVYAAILMMMMIPMMMMMRMMLPMMMIRVMVMMMLMIKVCSSYYVDQKYGLFFSDIT